MRFVDSNVFVHALLKPSRRLERHEAEIKEKIRKAGYEVTGITR